MHTTSTTTRKQGNYIRTITEGLPTMTLSLGNGKLAHGILIWNMPTVKTCPNSETCRTTCYAKKAERLYPNVLPCRERNYQASRLESFEDRMVWTIISSVAKHDVRAVRVHESGDFYSQAYADKWAQIAKRVHNVQPDVVFFAYTKSPYRPASGFNIVESIMPDGERNYGTYREMIALAKKYRAKVCPYGLSKRTITCGIECTACQTSKYVVFLKH
jgi:hypothetical protein